MCNEGCGGSVDILSGIGYCYKTNDLDVVSYKNGRVPWSNSRQQQVQCMCGDQPVAHIDCSTPHCSGSYIHSRSIWDQANFCLHTACKHLNNCPALVPVRVVAWVEPGQVVTGLVECGHSVGHTGRCNHCAQWGAPPGIESYMPSNCHPGMERVEKAPVLATAHHSGNHTGRRSRP